MSKLLILYLHKTGSITWVLKDNQGRLLKQQEASDPSTLTKYRNINSIVFVPAEDILLTSITLPKITANNLKKAIPFAIEEQLLEDINNVHIVSGSIQTDGSLPVAVIAKQAMKCWLGLLKKYNIYPSVLTSIVFAVPIQKANFIDESCIIRTDRFAGISCHVDHLPILAKDLQVKQATILEVLSSFSSQQEYINLLQGDYKIKKNKVDLFVLFLCVISLLSNILSFCVLKITKFCI